MMRRQFMIFGMVLAFGAGEARAQFTPGNLVVIRAGDGTAITGGAAAPVTVMQFSTTGVAGGTISLPSTGANAFTTRIDTTTGGFTSLSQNGNFLYLPGYTADSGTATIESSSVNRAVARFSSDGSVDTTTRFAFSGALRGVAAAGDGTAANGIYVVGESRVSTITLGGATATQIATGNMRAAVVADGKLFVSSGSGTAPYSRGVASFDPLPTGTATATNLVSQVSGQGLTQFILLDRDAGVAGVDTIYAADRDAGTIDKYSFDGTSWASRGTLTTAGIRGLTAQINGSAVDIYYTTQTELRSVSDSAGFNAALAGGTDSLLASAGTNNQFQGITFAPVPEPATVLGLAALGLGGVRLLRRRRVA